MAEELRFVRSYDSETDMRYIALATDYDGTLAHDGAVAADVVGSLKRLRESGRKLILVTGRELDELKDVFPQFELFDRIVAENGALLYNPSSKESRILADPPPMQLVENLRRRGVPEVRSGAVIVAMWRPHEQEALAVIHELGLEYQVIFNKDAVMILPSGVNKKTGMIAALKELKISPHNVVGVGDAENDHAFLGCCECAVAVANAIPALKEKADVVTRGSQGAGVAELIDELVETDLTEAASRLARHSVLLGKAGETSVTLNPFGVATLVCGHSGGGKSTLVSGVMERLIEKGYQICLIDPEGDFEEAEEFFATGDAARGPSLDHLESALSDPDTQLVVNMVGVELDERAGLFARVVAIAHEHRLRTARPHWLVIDEAHHMFPREGADQGIDLAGEYGSAILLTVHPGHVSPSMLKQINSVIVVGKEPSATISEFCKIAGKKMPNLPGGDLGPGQAWVWTVETGEPLLIQSEPARRAHERHKRKYAQGELEETRVFYFRGPGDRLNLRAQNLSTFAQIAKGVDDDTWLLHLRRGDYSRWLREAVKDDALAEVAQAVERNESLSPAESRSRIAQAIAERYTVPE